MVKTNSEYRSIRKKLMAAIAMVLVASIMVVSSSYAWFTLSTAPEVKGITTSVGSNGNLEMALRTGDLNAIGTSQGATGASSNTFWGNLVDLNYNENGSNVYGMDMLSLAPARLNAEFDDNASLPAEGEYTVTVPKASYNATAYKAGDTYSGDYMNEVITEAAAVEDGENYVWTIKTSGYVGNVYRMVTTSGYLQTPDYGVDGRVSQLNANTTNGIYTVNPETKVGSFGAPGYGVRAVGVTSDISDAALALRNAKQAVNAAIESAKSAGRKSMRDDAVPMADMIIQSKLNADYKYNDADIADLVASVNNLEAVVAVLRDALNQAVIAFGVSQGETLAVEDIDFSTDTLLKTTSDKSLTWENEDPRLADLKAADAKLTTMADHLSAAKNTLQNVIETKDESTYTDISSAMTNLVATNHVQILANGKVYTTESDPMEIAMAVMTGSPTVSLTGGIYADIAEFVGNFSQTNLTMTVNANGSEYESAVKKFFTDGIVEAAFTMSTNAAQPAATGYHLVYISTWMASLSAAGDDPDDSSDKITDFYGYILDLAFRTNAADSSLLLQTEAVNRVSEDSGDATQGEGSFMKFTTEAENFTNAQVVGLMQAIRVVLTADDGTIYGIAKLDVGLEDIADAVYNADEHHFYREDLVDGQITKIPQQLTAGEFVDGYVKAPLYLYNFTINGGAVSFGAKLSDGTITALAQNTPKELSVLVYLDGDMVGNEDVAVSGKSMTGSMNLQFASSAALVPMDYTFSAGEKLGNVEATITGDELTITPVTNATKYTVTYNGTEVWSGSSVSTVNLKDYISGVNVDGETLPSGNYEFEITASADGYTSSSTKVTYNYTA